MRELLFLAPGDVRKARVEPISWMRTCDAFAATGIDVTLATVLHHESDSAAMRAATEAVKKLLRWTHGERWRLFSVERAQPEVILPALFQLNIAADHVDDVDAREQVLNEALRDHVWRCRSLRNGPAFIQPLR